MRNWIVQGEGSTEIVGSFAFAESSTYIMRLKLGGQNYENMYNRRTGKIGNDRKD